MEDLSLTRTSDEIVPAKVVALPCQVCGEAAKGSCYGCVACEPCKMFFKRNAESKRKNCRCVFDGHCEINIHNRHVCSSCRLKKCFASGMQVDRLRGSYQKSNNNYRRLTTVAFPVRTSTKLPTLNLLQSDQSTLTSEQWILLSNLFQCYDEYSGITIGRDFMRQQTNLPVKVRFRATSVRTLIESLMSQGQFFYVNNRDFLQLSSDNRSILLANTMAYITATSANFIHSQIGLMDCPVFYEAIGIITDPTFIPLAQRVADRMIADRVVMKLFLAIMSFSTIRHTIYPNDSSKNFSNIQQILTIQDRYLELTWRYLLYTYKWEWTVKCFSDLIRCLFAISDGIVHAHDLVWFNRTVDSVVQQIEETLVIRR